MLKPGLGTEVGLESKEQLQRLLRLQELAVIIRGNRKLVEDAPVRVQEIENRFRERNAEYVAVKDRLDELEADQRNRTGELKLLEEGKTKYMDDLMQVKNQREYAAMLKEIDSVKAQIAEHEDAILRDMEEIEKVTEELGTHEEHIRTERVAVDTERAEVEEVAGTAREQMERDTAERTGIESELPSTLRSTLQQLEATRQGVFLSKVENGTCLSCFVRIRPQVFQEIRVASKVHRCSNCRRFLYFEPSLRPPAEPADPAADGVEAVNGGAV
jgi:predicted  nucleic acid-binding Zn-ribbon protein